MKSFRELITHYGLNAKKLIIGEANYYAHSKNNYSEYETLYEHIELVINYLLKLINSNRLESIIDKIITEYVRENNFLDKEYCSEYIKWFFVKCIYYHDFGKVNENFQNIKMKNFSFAQVNNKIDSQHSILSSYLFLASCFDEIKKRDFINEDKLFLSIVAYLYAYMISKHHSYIESGKDLSFDDDIVTNLLGYLDKLYNLNDIIKPQFQNFLKSKEEIFKHYNKLNSPFKLFLLLRLNYSLLTAADYYATNEFMIGLKCDDYGIMTEETKQKIIYNTYKISYNHSLQQNFDFYRSLKFSELQDFSNKNLNLLRQKLSTEIILNIRESIFERLFYIEAPTGSGKTNLSLLALVELLKKKNITKVFYVFPFTTLITQIRNYFTEYIELNDYEIAEIHSKASFFKMAKDYDEKDALYDCNRKNYIDNLFVNYPISLISHIKFFDILTSNEKEANYLLHRLANSIVIIDEIQSYNPTQWDKVNYLIQKYSELMNVTFIIMSATLPKISRLLFEANGISEDKFVYLVKNKHDYFQNPNFKNRVKFNFNYLEEDITIEELSEIVHRHSEEYYNNHKSVKTIVEFVTKISAHKFYEEIINNGIFYEYDICLITGTILEPRRKDIINYLKSVNSKQKKIIVICTQVIEAGLDIDMDIGFKDKAIVDSEEQFAGRINRNATRIDSVLYIFNLNDSHKTYRSDLRYKQKIDFETYKKILTEKDYDLLYDKVFEAIKTDIQNPYLSKNLTDYVSKIKLLSFKEVKEQFELIKDSTFSVFVPCEIDKKNFTVDEIKFLIGFDTEICKKKFIDGELVWNIYERIITSNEQWFDKKVNLKIISSIISKFIFSIWKNQNTIKLLLHYSDSDIKYGFLKLSKNLYERIYSYEIGLKTNLETDNFI